ncbi:hypothetical protein D3C86_1061880 [compost metagenome]
MADVKSSALYVDIVLEETPLVNTVHVEVLTETPYEQLPALRATIVGRHSLTRAQQTVEANGFRVEVLADDPTFVPLPEMKAAVVGRSVLSRPPIQIPLNRYTVEVLAETELEPLPGARAKALELDVVYEEIPTPDVSKFNVEILATTPLEQEVNEFIVEVLGADTDPVATNRYIVEVLADSTDAPILTRQQIIWYFNDH